MPVTKEDGVLSQFTVQQALAHANFPERGCILRCIVPCGASVILGILFLSRSQGHYVEQFRMNHAVAFDVDVLSFQLAQNLQGLPEEKSMAVDVVQILSLDKKRTGGACAFFESREVEHGLERIFPIDIVREHQERPLALRNRAQANPTLGVSLVPGAQ